MNNALQAALAGQCLPATGQILRSCNSVRTGSQPRGILINGDPFRGRKQSLRTLRASSESTPPAQEAVPATTVAVPEAQTLADSEIRAPENFVAPEPKRFALPSNQIAGILGSSLAPLLRLGAGVFVQGYSAGLQPVAEAAEGSYSFGSALGRRLLEKGQPGKRPEKPIVLYEFEGCPFCRKVREAATILDIDVLYYPCPRDGPNFRPKAIAMGGKKQFPYMVDPNTGVSMYESNEIIKYLAETYGNGTVPFQLRLGLFTDITAGLANLPRIAKGSKYVPAKQPPQPLELWAYEASPFCKIVREALCELEIPHVYHSSARGSAKRDQLLQRVGLFQVPYIEDPNTGIKMFESGAIVEYLYATYAK